ncbi:MAG: TPM domain-containing protein [Anaerococcus sp.]|nr:TPM domain-containing protein [Anaerococcus sp.]
MTKNRAIKLSLLSLLLIIFLPSLALARDLKEEVREYYYDELDILDDETKAHIIKVNKEIETKTGSQVLVMSLDNPDGLEALDYGTTIFNDLNIGDKNKDNGALILFLEDKNADKRQVAIVTGYGLEGRLNDSKVGRIIDNFMMDSFKDGDYSLGLKEGFNAVIAEIATEYGVELNGDYSYYQDNMEDNTFATIIGAVFIIFTFFFMLSLFSSRNRGRRIYRRGGYYPGTYWTLFNNLDDDDDYDDDSFSSWSGWSSGGSFSGGGGSSGGGGASRSF